MDPVTAYSVFCGIITTVDAAVKAVITIKELYDSSSGFSKETQRLQLETDNLTAIAKDLSSSQVQLSSVSPYPLLNRVVDECIAVSGKIQIILEKCKVDSHGPKAIAAVKAWARSQSFKSDLHELQRELQASGDRLQTAMAIATRADLSSMKQSLSKLGKSQSEIMEKISSISEAVSRQQNIFADKGDLGAVLEEAQVSLNHAAILRALRSTSIHSRESEISKHHRKTFEWILEDEHTDEHIDERGVNFLDWVKHGSGVFHFAGKPGSGKSTLFKFIANDQRVIRNLQHWASSTNKQLVLSKFFFWSLGSNDQKSVPGLLRGLLLDICLSNTALTELIFPTLWGKQGLDKEYMINDEEIETAFNQMLCSQDIRREFRFCFFIDGLDEFSGIEMTHWKLSRMLLDWTQQPAEDSTAENFLKICISSREDHSIMTVFKNSFRIRLQDVTKGDISAFVEESLSSNEYFLQLQEKFSNECQELVNSILRGADGVFLWVSLLLNLLEEELPGASSVAVLQNIVRTTPAQLEDFIANILFTIPKHHRRGACFVLAMALRMLGLHLSANGTFPAADQRDYQEIFGAERYWRPVLHTYGMSAVLQTLEMGTSPENCSSSLASLADGGHGDRCQEVTVKIRTWCRGLLETFTVDEVNIGKTFDQELDDYEIEHLAVNFDGNRGSWCDSEPKFAFLKFTHRSIPDILMSNIRNKAVEFSFNDDTVATAIIAMLVAETKSNYNETFALQRNLLYCYQHVFRLLRLRHIAKSSSTFSMLDELELARFFAYGRGHPAFFSECRDFTRRIVTLSGSQQEFRIYWDRGRSLSDAFHTSLLGWGRSGTVLTHATHAGLYEYVLWKLENNSTFREDPALLFSALGGLSAFYSWSWDKYPRCYTATLRLLLEAGAPIDIPIPYSPSLSHSTFLVRIWHAVQFLSQETPLQSMPREGTDPLAGWVWMVVLPSILNGLMSLPSRHATEHGSRLWEFLEVWLESGASPPVEFDFCSVDAQAYSGVLIERTVVKYKVWINSKWRDRPHCVRSGFKCDAVDFGDQKLSTVRNLTDLKSISSYDTAR